VHVRILAGVGAWLLGASTATAGSLLAVSLLGQGIAASPGQQLTADAVNQALAHESPDPGEASEIATQPPQPPVRTSPATRRAATRTAVSPPVPASPAPSVATPVPHAVTSPAQQATAGTVLTSRGGTVLAECREAGAYLVSWSPTQGYEASNVTRGPATTARVVFESDARSVTMIVSCPGGPGGTPVASSSVSGWGGGAPDE
jgi:hypothetical protein